MYLCILGPIKYDLSFKKNISVAHICDRLSLKNNAPDFKKNYL